MLEVPLLEGFHRVGSQTRTYKTCHTLKDGCTHRVLLITTLNEFMLSSGRIINVTSVRGRLAMPTDVCYTPTKWAGEAFSDILRREMYRFGVKVIIIEPGNFGGLTGMLNQENVRH